MNKQRSFQERWSTRRALVGLAQAHPNPLLTEMAGLCGYDFVMLDGEHGVFSDADYLPSLRALASTEALSMIRLPNHGARAIGLYLDMGVHALVAPHVSTAEQARTLAQAMLYPPAGTRSVGASSHRASRYGLDTASCLKSPRTGASLIVLIESKLGVDNVEEILAVEGVDGALIGPSDLSAELGSSGNFSHPDYIQAMTRIEQAARDTGKVLGTVPHAGHPIDALLARGYRFLITGAEMPLIREAMVAQVTQARASVQAAG